MHTYTFRKPSQEDLVELYDSISKEHADTLSKIYKRGVCSQYLDNRVGGRDYAGNYVTRTTANKILERRIALFGIEHNFEDTDRKELELFAKQFNGRNDVKIDTADTTLSVGLRYVGDTKPYKNIVFTQIDIQLECDTKQTVAEIEQSEPFQTAVKIHNLVYQKGRQIFLRNKIKSFLCPTKSN